MTNEVLKRICDLAAEMGPAASIEEVTREAIGRGVFPPALLHELAAREVARFIAPLLDEMVRRGAAVREVVDGEPYYRAVAP